MFPNPHTIVSTHRDVSKLQNLSQVSSDDEHLSAFSNSEKGGGITSPSSDSNTNNNSNNNNHHTHRQKSHKVHSNGGKRSSANGYNNNNNNNNGYSNKHHHQQQHQQHQQNGKKRHHNEHNHYQNGYSTTTNRSNKKHGHHHHHNNGLNNHYHYNPNYWECDSAEEENQTVTKPKPMPLQFNKETFSKIAPVAHLPTAESKLKQALKNGEMKHHHHNYHHSNHISLEDPSNMGRTPFRMMRSRSGGGGRYEPDSQDIGFRPFFCKFYFEEYLNEEPLRLEITSAWSVAVALTQAIKAYADEFPNRQLRGTWSEDYELRLFEDGDIDEDISAFARQSLIHELGDTVFGCKLNITRKPGGSIPSICKGANAYRLPQVEDRMFLRVSIPGPQNEAHVLAIDRDSTALTVRDIYALLNKKKQSVQFHPEFFNVYYEGNTKISQALTRSTKMVDLEQNSLMILPRILTENDDIQDAFQFKHVKLANEQREYQAVKIKTNSKNKRRILVVDRHRIVKKAVDENKMFNLQDHVPIDINLITNCVAKSGKLNKQFLIEYQQQGNLKSQIYEMSSSQECIQIVAKIRYLCALRKYQG